MSYSNLLERIMQRDTDAFLEFTDRYGWALYSSIRRKHPNKVDADKVYHETMQQLWSCMQSGNFDDPMEAILCTWADQISLKRTPQKSLSEIFTPDPEEQPPALRIRQAERAEERVMRKRKNRFWNLIGALALFVIFTFCIWIIVGFLMEQGIIAYIDLGYSWFCRQLQQLLVSWGVF